MLVKTFRAGDMSEALKMVKAELGADAMIISSKQERRKGILGIFSKPFYEVTAALDPKPPAPKANPYRGREERELTTKEEFQNSMLGPIARELRDLRDKVEKLSNREATFQPQQEPVSQQSNGEEPGGEKNQVPRRFAKEDLEEIKKYLLTAMNNKVKPEGAVVPVEFPLEKAAVVESAAGESEVEDMTALLNRIADELRAGGVDQESANLLLEYVRPAAAQGEELEELRYSLMEAFAGLIKCAGPLRLKKNGPKIMALVGPTGVGKTTTTAKLAAMYSMNKGASVALITTDNFRVGAFEQLKTYSKIMSIPLESASTPKELQKAIEVHGDKDLIIIDTAGRSPKDQEKLDELKAFLDPAIPIEIHLCLSTTTKDKELGEIVARFSALPITRLLFTKLDESESLGCIVNTHLRSKFQLSYFTNGQMVPEDIMVASPRKLANLVVRETPR